MSFWSIKCIIFTIIIIIKVLYIKVSINPIVYDKPSTIPGIASDDIVNIWINLAIFPFILAVAYAVKYVINVPITATDTAIKSEFNIYFPISLDNTYSKCFKEKLLLIIKLSMKA